MDASPSSSSEEIPVIDVSDLSPGGAAAHGSDCDAHRVNPCYITVETEKGELEKYR